LLIDIYVNIVGFCAQVMTYEWAGLLAQK